MGKWLSARILVVLVALLGSQSAWADTVVTLGDQDFADGATPTTGAFLTAGSGELAPFDGQFIGSDGSPTGPNFSASWTFTYTALSAAGISSASLVLGIYDHESAASGNQVVSFTMNGVDLTASMNTLFEAHGGASREDNVYTLALPTSVFSNLASGSVTFALSLAGPGLGVFGETPFNGAALDFSTLSILTQQTPPPPSVPEPVTPVLLLIGLSALMLFRRQMA